MAALASVVGVATGQRIPSNEYIHFVPLDVPRATQQTAASRELSLFGDRADADYRDKNPRDGIDDVRGERLLALATRFAPLLVQNSSMSAPLDAAGLTDSSGRRILQRDTWNTKAVEKRLVSSIPIDLNADDPQGLRDLLADYHPFSPLLAIREARSVRPEESLVDIVWLDLQGATPHEWDSIYVDPHTGALRERYQSLVRTFAHPFIGGTAETGFELLIQYWFFYPFNDGGNNHTGDWEHINVVIAPLDKVTAPLTADDIEGMLDAPDEQMAHLVLRRIEYYPHNKVILFDLSNPNVYADRDAWKKQVDTLYADNSGLRWISHELRRRAYEDAEEQVINNHPTVYIGADNKGTDQILSPPGGSNRDSHASYPFAGLFKDIGPAGAAEEIDHRFDHRDYFRLPLDRRRDMETFKKGGVVDMSHTGRITIVPDVDRIADDILDDRELLKNWYWLVTPMRWGYPAIRSPFAGIVANAETGNLGAVGPSFNDAWNRVGVTPVYQAFDAQPVPSFFPTAWQDEFKNSFGYLNLGWPTISFLPPFDLLYRGAAAPVRLIIEKQKPKFFAVSRLPMRFIGVSSGVSVHFISEKFDRLLFNRQQIFPLLTGVVEALIEAGTDSTSFGPEVTEIDAAVSPYGQVNFFLGSRFVSENNLRHSRSGFLQTTTDAISGRDLTLGASLNMWEYYGSLRYNVFTNNVQPFLKAGYGLSWYRYENVAVNGKVISEPHSPWIRKPNFAKFKNILPNTLHFGSGLEIMLRKGYEPRLLRGADIALKFEWMVFRHAIGVEFEDVPIDLLVALNTPLDSYPLDTGVWRHSLHAGLTISL